MAANTMSAAAKLRARLDHPVIDSDGHWVEFGPQLNDYLKLVGGTKALEGFKSRPTEDWHLTIPVAERRERRLDAPVWWGVPTRNTLDHATSMLPRLLYERLDDFGFDFVVLYPSAGLRTPFIVDAALRQVACRAFNMFSADLFRPYRDRLTPAAVIPMHTPAEAIAELEYAVKTLGLKVAMMASLIRRFVRVSLIRAITNGSTCSASTVIKTTIRYGLSASSWASHRAFTRSRRASAPDSRRPTRSITILVILARPARPYARRCSSVA